jgi:hypothetical protein
VTRLRPRTVWTVRLPLLLAGAILLVVACGSAAPTIGPTADTSSSAGSLAPSVAPSAVPSAVPSASEVPGPGPSDTPPASSGPVESPSSGPISSTGPSPGPTPGDSSGPAPSPTNAASVCSGAKDTPDFYESFASSVNFPVYCAVLPAGWSLVSGTYRLAGGGHITIQFRRRSDNATFELDQGSFCTDSSGCVPNGTAVGSGPYGDLTGDLIQTSNGYALVVARGEKPSWLAVGTGLDQATFVALTAALVSVN